MRVGYVYLEHPLNELQSRCLSGSSAAALIKAFSRLFRLIFHLLYYVGLRLYYAPYIFVISLVKKVPLPLIGLRYNSGLYGPVQVYEVGLVGYAVLEAPHDLFILRRDHIVVHVIELYIVGIRIGNIRPVLCLVAIIFRTHPEPALGPAVSKLLVERNGRVHTHIWILAVVIHYPARHAERVCYVTRL